MPFYSVVPVVLGIQSAPYTDWRTGVRGKKKTLSQ